MKIVSKFKRIIVCYIFLIGKNKMKSNWEHEVAQMNVFVIAIDRLLFMIYFCIYQVNDVIEFSFSFFSSSWSMSVCPSTKTEMINQVIEREIHFCLLWRN